ncbi:hypothetical protein [Paraburkholderia aspalathi]|nr:hypothetical protein [Paraburkholderia aspalathi]CAE6701576.1 hypothetical protein R20943_00596 [Paraburkholderia aspalathi]
MNSPQRFKSAQGIEIETMIGVDRVVDQNYDPNFGNAKHGVCTARLTRS